MNVFRVLVGSLLGGAAGAVIWAMAEKAMSREIVFLVLLVGLLAGLGARWFGQLTSRNIAAGALAALVTLAAIVGSKYALAALWSRQGPANVPTVGQVDRGPVDDGQTDSAQSTEVDSRPEEMVRKQP